jgi:hypothetical protein
LYFSSVTEKLFLRLSQIRKFSLADPGCLSRIPDPGFYTSRIPDPKTAIKERGEKKKICHTFFCSHKFHKIANYLIFLMFEKKFDQFSKILRTFYPKNCHQALKNMG